MKIRLLSVTHKCPAWVQAGYEEYAKRMPAACSLELIEIPAEKRTNNADLKRITEKEGEKLLAAIKPQHRVIALDIQGKPWNTEQLSAQMTEWLQGGQNLDLLVGGSEGLSEACLKKAETRWSLSPLTFPHCLVRVLVAEQLYRAHSLLIGHPYHK